MDCSQNKTNNHYIKKCTGKYYSFNIAPYFFLQLVVLQNETTLQQRLQIQFPLTVHETKQRLC